MNIVSPVEATVGESVIDSVVGGVVFGLHSVEIRHLKSTKIKNICAICALYLLSSV